MKHTAFLAIAGADEPIRKVELLYEERDAADPAYLVNFMILKVNDVTVYEVGTGPWRKK